MAPGLPLPIPSPGQTSPGDQSAPDHCSRPQPLVPLAAIGAQSGTSSIPEQVQSPHPGGEETESWGVW